MDFNFQRTNYFFILSLGAMLIGFAPIFVKLSYLSPSAITFYRMSLALPFIYLLNAVIHKTNVIKLKNKKTLFYSALASLAFTVDLTLWHYSMELTSVSNATIIVNSAPIFVAALSFIVFKEKLSANFFKSFLITYLGIFGLIYFSNNYTEGQLTGDFLCLVAALFYGTYLLIIGKLGDESSISIIFYTTLFCCVFSIPIMLLENAPFIPINKLEWTNMFLLAFLCQFGGQFLITYGIGKISASEGSIGLLMQPLTATVLAAIIFNEILNFIQILFILVTFIGLYLARINISKT